MKTDFSSLFLAQVVIAIIFLQKICNAIETCDNREIERMVVTKTKLSHLARTAVDRAYNEAIMMNGSEKVDPNSNDNTANQRSILIAKHFVLDACPEFLESSISKDDDRLVKVGRAIEDMLQASSTDCVTNTNMSFLEASLSLIVEECAALASGLVKVPKVRFGKTNLQMPIVTLGTMRLQQSWNRGETSVMNMDQVTDDCQNNLKKILRYAINDLGMNHIETARGYGSSELQIGDALKSLIENGEVKREDLIIQTKIGAFPTAQQFRNKLEESFKNLQLEYIDLFSFHGLNMNKHYDMVFDNGENGNCYDVVQEYVKAGKIRHVGFSTHGTTDVIQRFIETDKFEYVNLHYHYYNSYTAGGGGGKSGGNLDNIKLLNKKDMGVFIISPYDKGGRLYAPSRKLRSLTLPELEPMTHASLWLWNHHKLVSNDAKIHTIVCGAARPSDLDQPAIAAYFHQKRKDEMFEKTQKVSNRLYEAAVAQLGEKWLKTWHFGLPNCSNYEKIIQFGQIVQLYNILKAYGLHGYCKERYANFELNSNIWDENISIKENIDKNGMWGWTPGIDIDPENNDYAEELSNVPDENKDEVLAALKFVKKYCKKDSDPNIPKEWETAYDMRPWNAFPERT